MANRTVTLGTTGSCHDLGHCSAYFSSKNCENIYGNNLFIVFTTLSAWWGFNIFIYVLLTIKLFKEDPAVDGWKSKTHRNAIVYIHLIYMFVALIYTLSVALQWNRLVTILLFVIGSQMATITAIISIMSFLKDSYGIDDYYKIKRMYTIALVVLVVIALIVAVIVLTLISLHCEGYYIWIRIFYGMMMLQIFAMLILIVKLLLHVKKIIKESPKNNTSDSETGRLDDIFSKLTNSNLVGGIFVLVMTSIHFIIFPVGDYTPAFIYYQKALDGLIALYPNLNIYNYIKVQNDLKSLSQSRSRGSGGGGSMSEPPTSEILKEKDNTSNILLD